MIFNFLKKKKEDNIDEDLSILKSTIDLNTSSPSNENFSKQFPINSNLNQQNYNNKLDTNITSNIFHQSSYSTNEHFINNNENFSSPTEFTSPTQQAIQPFIPSLTNDSITEETKNEKMQINNNLMFPSIEKIQNENKSDNKNLNFNYQETYLKEVLLKLEVLESKIEKLESKIEVIYNLLMYNKH